MKHTVILPILFSATLFAGCTTVGNYMGNDTVSLNKEAAMAYQQKKKRTLFMMLQILAGKRKRIY